jgi:hypothetical protein
LVARVVQPAGAMTDTRVRTASDHACHFYADDTGLSTTVAAFLAPAFSDGHAVISIGTRAHIAGIEQRLRTDGHDIDSARRRGQYVALDAESILARLLTDGLPTARTFQDVIGVQVDKLATEHGGVRAFGEIVNVLWRQGKRAAALRLEELWSDALGYRIATDGIVSVHTQVIPSRMRA